MKEINYSALCNIQAGNACNMPAIERCVYSTAFQANLNLIIGPIKILKNQANALDGLWDIFSGIILRVSANQAYTELEALKANHLVEEQSSQQQTNI